MNTEHKGKLAVISAASTWGIGAVILKYLFNSGFGVITMMFYSTSFTILFMLLFWKKIKFKQKWSDFKYIILATIFGNMTGFSIFFAFSLTKVAIAEFLRYTMPAFAFIFAVFFLKEKVGKWRISALILSLLGIGLVFNIKMLFNGFNLINLGNMLALLAAIASAAQLSAIKKVKANQYTLNFWNFLLSFPIILPLYLFNNTITSVGQIGVLFVYTIIFMAIPMLLFLYGVKKIEVTKSSILMLCEVIVAVIVAWIFLKETITIQTIIGGLLVLISATILIIKKK